MNWNKPNDYRIKMISHKLTRRFLVIIIIVSVIFCFTNITGYAKNQAIGNHITKDQATNNMVQSDQYQYGIGSVSKMFCAVAVMKLVDEGKIDLDTPLTTYIPEFRMADERYKKITPKMLLNHSSGIMGTTWHNSMIHGDADASYHDTFLEQLKTQELKADPGEYSVYCNDGFTLAEILVERVSGMSFSEFIKKEISIPLGLSNTSTPKDNLDEDVLAPTYFNNYSLPYVNEQEIASGGIYSTPEELCKFSQIFMKNSDHHILSKESVDIMSKPWYLNDKICVNVGDSQVGYGLGWDSVNAYPYNLYGLKALSKGGDIMGYHANLTVLPEQNLSIAMTSSGGSSSYCEESAQDIILEVLKEEGLIRDIKDIKIKAENKVDIAPLPDDMKQFEGYYHSQNILKVNFNEEGTLLVTPIDTEYDTTQEYVYTKSGEFVSTKGYYIGDKGALLSNANGNKGLTKFSFRKEANGKVYMIGTAYESTNGLGETAYTMPFAEKIEPNNISDSVLTKWKERTNRKYYLVDEVYNSCAFLDDPIISFKPLDEIPGYVARYKNKNSAEKCRIIDENTAKCDVDIPLMLGRDLFQYKFSYKNKVEYVSVESFHYVGEEVMKSSETLTNENVVIEDDLTAWYKISQEDAGTIMKIKAPDHGAYYVYDKDDTCIASSLFKEAADTIMLPTDGHIVLAGKKGAIFHITRE